jgi:hypothetical protein
LLYGLLCVLPFSLQQPHIWESETTYKKKITYRAAEPKKQRRRSQLETFNTLISELEINTQFGTLPLLFHSIQSFSNGTHIPVYSSPFGFWVAYPDGSFSMLPQHLADHLMNI